MKITFIYRKSIEGSFLAYHLHKKYKNVQLIEETGSLAKAHKLKRTFPYSKILFWPFYLVDIATLQLYEFFYSRYLLKNIKPRKPAADLVINDVNDASCLESVLRYNPNILLIFGTAIIKEPFMKKVGKPIFNIHTGILPKYRNVHSEFWAYRNKDFKHIGVTIIHLDKGVDSGEIALQNNVTYHKNDSLFNLRLKTFQLIMPLLDRLIILSKKGSVPKLKQSRIHAVYYKTPRFLDILHFSISEFLNWPATR